MIYSSSDPAVREEISPESLILSTEHDANRKFIKQNSAGWSRRPADNEKGYKIFPKRWNH